MEISSAHWVLRLGKDFRFFYDDFEASISKAKARPVIFEAKTKTKNKTEATK